MTSPYHLGDAVAVLLVFSLPIVAIKDLTATAAPPVPLAPLQSYEAPAKNWMVASLSKQILIVNGKSYKMASGADISPTPVGRFTLKAAVPGANFQLPNSKWFIEFKRQENSEIPDTHPYKNNGGLSAYGIHEGDTNSGSLGCIRVSAADLDAIASTVKAGDVIEIKN